MKNTIVWVYGLSAIGKETFVRHVAENKPKQLIDELGWNDHEIVVCQESIDHVVKKENDGNKELRKNLEKVILKLSEAHSGAVILIKTQDLDFDFNHLVNIKKQLPNDDHVMIYLYDDPNVVYTRYQKKEWWVPEFTLDVYKKDLVTQSGYLNEYKELGFKMIGLQSDQEQLYPIIDISFLLKSKNT
jgi:hypothetical protein